MVYPIYSFLDSSAYNLRKIARGLGGLSEGAAQGVPRAVGGNWESRGSQEVNPDG